VRKCPYCDFNSYRAPAKLAAREYCDALLADLSRDAGWVEGRSIRSVFFGGGTPSLFPAHEIERFLVAASKLVSIEPNAEITLEANPASVERQAFAGYASAGVNRISLGVQSFDDDSLRQLGRVHTADEARRAVEEVSAAGLASFNLDLMYGLPRQDEAGANADIRTALSFEPPHVSWYQLTLEPGTLFSVRPPKGLPTELELERIERSGRALLHGAGFRRYETSAWARSGQRCRHNQNYWRFGDYLGIGAGAHGKITHVQDGSVWRTSKQRHPTAFRRVAASRQRLAELSKVSALELGFEFMLNALRLHQPVTEKLLHARTGLRFRDLQTPIGEAVARGLLRADAMRLYVTRLGRCFLNDLQACFLPPQALKSTECELHD